jgi:hypothetical protein
MNNNVHYVLCGVALLLGICGLIRPSWPVVAVAVVLLAIDGFIKA